MNTTQRTFLRHRTLEELRVAVMKEGWELKDELLKKGWEGVSFKFQVGKTEGFCVFNTVNGTFVGRIDSGSIIFSSQSGKHDNCGWFKKLLTVCLIEKPAENVKAFGFDVDIEVATGPASSKVITKHWRTKSVSLAQAKGRLVSCAKRVLKCTPLTETQWIAAYGDPRLKNES